MYNEFSNTLVLATFPFEIDNARAALGVNNNQLKGIHRTVTNKSNYFYLPEKRIAAQNGKDFISQYIDAVGILFGDYGPSSILCNSELELIPAAALREHFGLPGQTLRSAVAFRDKVVMKSVMSAAGVPVPRFRVCESEDAIFNAMSEWDSDVLLKPRDGYGSVGIKRFRREYRPLFLDLSAPNDFMIEEFIDGSIFHIDGLLFEGNVVFSWASEYITAPLDYKSALGGGSLILEAIDPQLPLLLAFAQRCLTGMPTPLYGAFHLDVFKDMQGRLLAGEISSRPGGNRIRGSIFRAFGVDMLRAAYRAQAGLKLLHKAPNQPLLATGWGAVRMRQGVVQEKAEMQNPPVGIVSPRFNAKVGDHLTAANGGSDNLLSFLIEGKSQADVRQKWTQGIQWASECCARSLNASRASENVSGNNY